MSNIFTRRLVGMSPSSASDLVVYTTPASTQVVVRNILVSNTSGSSQIVQLFLELAGNTPTVLFETLAANQVFHLDTRIGLNPGDQLHYRAFGGSSALTITGFVFPD